MIYSIYLKTCCNNYFSMQADLLRHENEHPPLYSKVVLVLVEMDMDMTSSILRNHKEHYLFPVA